MIIKCKYCMKEFDKASRRNQHEKDAHKESSAVKKLIKQIERRKQ